MAVTADRPGMVTLGIDLGTSGVRAVVLDAQDRAVPHAVGIAMEERWDAGALWARVAEVLRALDLSCVQAIAVDGTSGTLLAVDAAGAPLGRLSPYSDPASPLRRAVALQAVPGAARVLHEADWIAGRLCGRFDFSDENNALKTGYDLGTGTWTGAGLDAARLPRVVAPGSPVGPVTPAIAAAFGLRGDAVVAAGTTDGCASFLSTGAAAPGDAVTVLGSTMTLKLLSDRPVAVAALGIYSHRLLGRWLAGGASNTGGAVLAQWFTPAQLADLSARIDPDRDSGLDYYPLPRPGERFPICDPELPPRLLPRPDDDAAFLHGLLEGIARIEALGYRRLAEHGGPPVRRVLSVGGGAGNAVWTAIRARVLGVEVLNADHASAAHGAALLARRAVG